MSHKRTSEFPSLQEALRQPLSFYLGAEAASDDVFSNVLVKILIDYKCGRSRQSFKRYKTCLLSCGLDPEVSLLVQKENLNEQTAQLLVFELIFQLTGLAEHIDIEVEEYIDAMDLLGPDDRVLHGALYNVLLPMTLRSGSHAVARQFAALAIDEYSAAKAPYLEAFVYLHLALVEIAQADFTTALKALDTAERLFGVVPNTVVEKTQIGIARAWIGLERDCTAPSDEWLETTKAIALSGELWSETFLMLAVVLYRAAALTGSDRILEVHAELETVMRVRRMTALLPLMQILRGEYFGHVAPDDAGSSPVQLDEFQLLLLQPSTTTLVINHGAEVGSIRFNLDRVKATQHLWQAKHALNRRQFSMAADHMWPALALIQTHGFLGLLNSERRSVEAFLAECRARRRFVEQARHIRDVLLPRIKRPEVLTQVPKELTAAEYCVLSLLPEATSNKGIARDLDVSEATVKFHLRSIYRKLEVHRRRDAIKEAAARGWINLPGTSHQSGT